VIKIHIDTTSLQAHRPAIVVLEDDKQPPLAQTTAVSITCPACGTSTASVEQHQNVAHVVVPMRASVNVNGEPV